MAKAQLGNGVVSARRKSPGELNYEPLYKQVKRALVQRIAGGEWRPGDLIPSEFELADELTVSQGTVRKALDEMTADNLLLRVQGRGTFVSRFDDEKLLFHFFRVAPDQGAPTFPDSRVISLERARADGREAAALDIREGTAVWRLARCRTLSDAPVIAEKITLPRKIFTDLGGIGDLPNNIYGLFADRYGVTVARAEEKLKAVRAAKEEAALLGCDVGDPLLQISRRAHDIAERIVEWRVSHCLTADVHYGLDIK
jgi:GntR family transcriptional regulator